MKAKLKPHQIQQEIEVWKGYRMIGYALLIFAPLFGIGWMLLVGFTPLGEELPVSPGDKGEEDSRSFFWGGVIAGVMVAAVILLVLCEYQMLKLKKLVEGNDGDAES